MAGDGLPFQRQPVLMRSAGAQSLPPVQQRLPVSLTGIVASVYDVLPVGGYGISRDFTFSTPAVAAGASAQIEAGYTVPANKTFVIRNIQVAWSELISQDLTLTSSFDGIPTEHIKNIAIPSFGADYNCYIVAQDSTTFGAIVTIDNQSGFPINAGTMTITITGDLLNTGKSAVGDEVATK